LPVFSSGCGIDFSCVELRRRHTIRLADEPGTPTGRSTFSLVQFAAVLHWLAHGM